MKEVKQMLWMVLGVLVGFSTGLYALLKLFEVTGNRIADNPTLALFVAIPILGGGLVGGGYLAQWLVYRYTKAQRAKRQAARDEAWPAKSKKKKK